MAANSGLPAEISGSFEELLQGCAEAPNTCNFSGPNAVPPLYDDPSRRAPTSKRLRNCAIAIVPTKLPAVNTS